MVAVFLILFACVLLYMFYEARLTFLDPDITVSIIAWMLALGTGLCIKRLIQTTYIH